MNNPEDPRLRKFDKEQWDRDAEFDKEQWGHYKTARIGERSQESLTHIDLRSNLIDQIPPFFRNGKRHRSFRGEHHRLNIFSSNGTSFLRYVNDKTGESSQEKLGNDIMGSLPEATELLFKKNKKSFFSRR